MTAVACNGTFRVGVSGSLDRIRKFALFSPSDVGANRTLTVHDLDCAMALPRQLLLRMRNSSLSSPLIERGPIIRSSLPVFVMVNIIGDDVPATYILPKLWDVGKTKMAGSKEVVGLGMGVVRVGVDVGVRVGTTLSVGFGVRVDVRAGVGVWVDVRAGVCVTSTVGLGVGSRTVVIVTSCVSNTVPSPNTSILNV